MADITLKKLLKKYGDSLQVYAEDEAKEIELYFNTKGIEIYDIYIDSDDFDERSISIADTETFIRYLENHSIREVLKYKEVIEREVFISAFLEKAEKGLFQDEENREKYIKKGYELYSEYINTVVGESICTRIIYCLNSCPIILFSCYSDLMTITEVEDEIICGIVSGIDEIGEHIVNATVELDELFEFLINDPEFHKCTNALLRQDYMRRNQNKLFKNKRFPNLDWVIKNYFKIKGKGSTEAYNIVSRWRIIHDIAWKEIKNNKQK
jgi:hypothetical protein